MIGEDRKNTKQTSKNKQDDDQQFQSIAKPKQSQQVKSKKIAEKQQQPAKQEKKKSSGFMSGFLLGNNQKKAPPKKPQEDITHIKSTMNQQQRKKKSLQIPQVQESMKSKLLQNKNQWMTPSFLQQIAKNPILLQALSNPESMQAIQMFQTDPKKAMEMYGKNPQFQKFMTEFSKVMGKQFENVAKEKQQKQEKQVKSEQIVEHDPIRDIIDKDPMVKSLLQDPKVMQAITKCQTEGRLDFSQMMYKDAETAMKLKVLIDKGVLNMNRQT